MNIFCLPSAVTSKDRVRARRKARNRAIATAAAEHNKTITLLTLPPKLRNLIWDEATRDLRNVRGDLVSLQIKTLHTGRSLLRRPQLACKQMNEELRSHIIANTTVRLVSEPKYRILNNHAMIRSNVIHYGTSSEDTVCRHIHDYCMELPGNEVRPRMRSLHFVFPVPGSQLDDEFTYTDACVDWLYSLCQFKALGFDKMDRLVVELEGSKRSGRTWESDVKVWVETKMVEHGVDAQEVQFFMQEVGDGRRLPRARAPTEVEVY